MENFTATRTGFTAETDYDTDRLVFFSVPYDDGRYRRHQRGTGQNRKGR